MKAIIFWIYPFVMVSLAVSMVGKIPQCSIERYSWELPVTMFWITVVPLFIGYFYRTIDED